MTRAYLSTASGPNISDFFDLSIHYVSLIHGRSQEGMILEELKMVAKSNQRHIGIHV